VINCGNFMYVDPGDAVNCIPCPGSSNNRVNSTQPCNPIDGTYASPCATGFYEDSNKVCQPCIANCDVCSDSTTCTTCRSTFMYQNNGAKPFSQMCVRDCADGTTLNIYSHASCRTCPGSRANRSNPSQYCDKLDGTYASACVAEFFEDPQ
jgi:hypothetical protein